MEAVPGNGGSSDELLLGMIILRPRTLWRKFGGSADGSRGLYPQDSIPTVATCNQDCHMCCCFVPVLCVEEGLTGNSSSLDSLQH